jgi:DNA-binding beta-propeller fold protein YncE
MKRPLLCALFLLLCGCQHETFYVNTKGTLYQVECTEGNGVMYTETPINPTTGLALLSAPPKTYVAGPSISTCAQLAAVLAKEKDGVILHPSSRAGTTAATSQPLQYLLDQASLSVQILDPSPFNLTEVDLPGGGYTQYPTGMDMTPDGSTIWVTQLAIGQNNAGITPEPPLVSIMNVAQQAFTGSLTLPNGISPNSIRFSLDGTSAYISNDGSAAEGESGVFANSSVLMVDVATQTVAKTIPTPKGAGSEVLSPDGLLFYTIGNNFGLGANNLTVIDTTTNTVAASVALPDGGVKIFVNPTGTRLYVIWLRGIDVFDTATLQQVASIPGMFSFLTNFAYFTPDGSIAWFLSGGYGIYYQVDVQTNQVINTIQSEAHGFMFGTF